MLGPRIAVLRRAAGLSQGELARRLQVSPSTIGMYEQDRREPSAELLVAMARIFGVTVDYLLTGQASAMESDVVRSAMGSVLEQSSPNRRLSRQEVAVLFAALLMDG